MVLANSGSAFLPEVDGVRKVDSFTLNFGKWFGLATPSCQSASLLPTATILLSVDWSTHKAASATSSMMSLNNATPTSPSSSLPNQTSPISTAATTVSSSSKRAKVLAVSVDQNNFLKIEKGSTAASQQSPPSTHFIKSVPLHLTLPFWIFSEIVSSRKCKVRALQAAEMAKSFGAKCLVSSSSTRLMASYKDYEKGTSLVSLVRYNHVEEQGSSSSSLDLDISAYMETMKAKCNYGTKLVKYGTVTYINSEFSFRLSLALYQYCT